MNFRLADISAKVFSVSCGITVGGMHFDGSVIKSMRLVKESERLPVRGIVSSTVYAAVKTAFSFEPNDTVFVSGGGMSFAPHFIGKVSRRGDILYIEAGDRMRRTEKYFDDSLYNEEDQPYNASLLLANLANQCGFNGCENIPSCFTEFYFGDIHGKTCREILDLVSEYAVGVWACTNSDYLRFEPFLSCTASLGVSRETSSRIYFHSAKGPYQAVCGRNTGTGEVYISGSLGSFSNVLSLSGRLLDNERVSQIMSQTAGKKFQSYYCDHLDISGAPDGLTAFFIGQGEQYESLVCTKTEIIFGGGGVYGRAAAGDIFEDEWELRDLKDYEIRKRVEEFRQYGSVVMTDKGLGIVTDGKNDEEENKNENDSDIRKKKTYFFSKAENGVTKFDGAIIDGKMPDRIEKISDESRKIVYGKTAYILKFNLGEDGSRTNISFKKEGEK